MIVSAGVTFSPNPSGLSFAGRVLLAKGGDVGAAAVSADYGSIQASVTSLTKSLERPHLLPVNRIPVD